MIFRILNDSSERWMIVADRHRRNLHVDVEQSVSVGVSYIVADRSLIVGKEDYGATLLERKNK